MASTTTTEPEKDTGAVVHAIVSAATQLSTLDLANTIKTMQQVLTDRTTQSSKLPQCFDGVDRTKFKINLLVKPTKKSTRFLENKGRIYPDTTKAWVFHVGDNGQFEIVYGHQENMIAAGTMLAVRSALAFGPALFSGGFPEHEPGFSEVMHSGVWKLVKRLNEECGDVAPWKWDRQKAVALVAWAWELTGIYDRYVDQAIDESEEGDMDEDDVEEDDDTDDDAEMDEDDEMDGDEDE